MSNCWGNIWSVAKRELSGTISSPVAYVFVVIFLLLSSFFTFMIGGFFERGQASLISFFGWHPWLYLFLVPAVGMRMWAEERRSGTIELLFTLPITTWQAIAGKFLAYLVIIAVALLLTFPVWITVNYLGAPDNGVILASYIGSLLLGASYLAVTSFTSALTRNQVVSFILAVVICLFLILCGWPPVLNLLNRVAGQGLVDLVAAFSFMTHFENIQRGVLDLRDIVFFASVIVFFLFATHAVLRARRAG
jgi:ABC-2 type transport system permease protein